MSRALTLAMLAAVLLFRLAAGQELGVLHIKVTLTDAAHTSVPIPRAALLISDNPPTSTPRRVVTKADGTATVDLRPGNYTVESDEPVAFDGKGYEWVQTLDIPAGRESFLELTAENAEVGPAPAPSPSRVTTEAASPAPLPRWKDSGITVWTPESRASGFLVSAAGLVVTNQRAIGSASAVDVQLTPAVKVAARVLAADPEKDIAVLWIDAATTASVRLVPLDCHNVPVGDACEVVTSAEKAMQTAQQPVATHLPVEPERPFPVDALDAAVKSRLGSLNPYRTSSSGFDVAFLTPVLIRGAQQRPNARGQAMSPGKQIDPTDFGDWSEYFEDVPPVLVIRVTPKLTEGFWTTVARGAAYTQGMALPPIQHFKPGFLRMRALCGDVEVIPIHPFTLTQRVSETDAIREGLYVFDPQAFGPHCASVRLEMFSEKAPAKPDLKAVDPQTIQRIWQDFAPYRP